MTDQQQHGSADSAGVIADNFGRRFRYLRVALNERCNLRCIYCMPAEGLPFKEGGQLLSAEEVVRVVRALATVGVCKVRLSGGEPLLRRDLVEIVTGAASIAGVRAVHLTTNGLLLERRLAALRDAGLRGVNISLDTLDAARFKLITRREGLEAVLSAVRAAVAIGIEMVKLNVVVMRGVNDDEIGAFAEMTRELPITVRFIELMPFDAHQVWRTGKFLRAELIVERLRAAFPELASSTGSSTEHQVFQIAGAAGRCAVIPAYTRSLCATCDRIRLTADGKIRNCLYSEREFELRALLRGGADDRAICALVGRAIAHKLVDGWAAQREAERLSTDDDASQQPSGCRESMTQIGG